MIRDVTAIFSIEMPSFLSLITLNSGRMTPPQAAIAVEAYLRATYFSVAMKVADARLMLVGQRCACDTISPACYIIRAELQAATAYVNSMRQTPVYAERAILRYFESGAGAYIACLRCQGAGRRKAYAYRDRAYFTSIITT